MENKLNIAIAVTSSVEGQSLGIYDGVPATLTITLTPDQDISLAKDTVITASFDPVSPSPMAIGEIPSGWLAIAPGTLKLTADKPGWSKNIPLTFTITNIIYTQGQSPISLSVLLDNISGDPFPVIAAPAITISVNEKPSPEGVHITENLKINFYTVAPGQDLGDSQTMLYVSPQSETIINNLYLSLSNITDKGLFSGSKSKGIPVAKIWFIYGTDSGCLAPSYIPSALSAPPASTALANNIACFVNNQQGNNWQVLQSLPDPKASTPTWEISPNSGASPIIGTGAGNTVSFDFQNIISHNDPGTTLVYIQFTGFWRDDNTPYIDETFSFPLIMQNGPFISSFSGKIGDDGNLSLSWQTQNASSVEASWTASKLDPSSSTPILPPLAPTGYTITASNLGEITSSPLTVLPQFIEIHLSTSVSWDLILNAVAVNSAFVYLVDQYGNLFTYNIDTANLVMNQGLVTFSMSGNPTMDIMLYSTSLNQVYFLDQPDGILCYIKCNEDGSFQSWRGAYLQIPDSSYPNYPSAEYRFAFKNKEARSDVFQLISFIPNIYQKTSWFTMDSNGNYTYVQDILTGSQQKPFFIANTFDDEYLVILNSYQYFAFNKTSGVCFYVTLQNYSIAKMISSAINYSTFLLDTTNNKIIATNFINTLSNFFNLNILPAASETFIDFCFSPDYLSLLVLTKTTVLIVNAVTPNSQYYKIPIINESSFVITAGTRMSAHLTPDGLWRIILNDNKSIFAMEFETGSSKSANFKNLFLGE